MMLLDTICNCGEMSIGMSQLVVLKKKVFLLFGFCFCLFFLKP